MRRVQRARHFFAALACTRQSASQSIYARANIDTLVTEDFSSHASWPIEPRTASEGHANDLTLGGSYGRAGGVPQAWAGWSRRQAGSTACSSSRPARRHGRRRVRRQGAGVSESLPDSSSNDDEAQGGHDHWCQRQVYRSRAGICAYENASNAVERAWELRRRQPDQVMGDKRVRRARTLIFARVFSASAYTTLASGVRPKRTLADTLRKAA